MNFDSSVLQVAIEDIIPNRFQPRLNFDDASLQDLADSIKQHGIIQPLVLRRTGDKYEIIAGERRYKAAKLAGLSSLPAVISQIDDKTSAEVAIAENVQRKQLSAIEEAKSYKAILDLGYMNKEQLSQKIGITTEMLTNKLRLLSLCEEVQNAVIDGKISERHAKALLIINDPLEQIKWLNRIIEERMTVRVLDQELKKFYAVNQNTSYELEKIKQVSQDIVNPVPVKEEVKPQIGTFAAGPIDLGEKKQNRFFNSLEDEEVNMKMAEPINPFLNNNSFVSSFNDNDVDSLATGDEVEMLNVESLDFSPQTSQTKNLELAKQKVESLINDLKNNNYNVSISNNDLGKEITFVITIN